MPGYFAQDATDRLTAFQERAPVEGDTALLGEFPAVEHDVVDTWRPGAAQIYRNWLTSIAAEKDQRQRSIGSSPKQPALIKPAVETLLHRRGYDDCVCRVQACASRPRIAGNGVAGITADGRG